MIKTAKKYKNHQTIGHWFRGFSNKTWQGETYYCDSYDPAIGFWMTNINNSEDRKNVSEMAIGVTFYHDHKNCPHKNCNSTEVKQ